MVSKRRLTEYAESSHFKKFLYIDFETKDNHENWNDSIYESLH